MSNDIISLPSLYGIDQITMMHDRVHIESTFDSYNFLVKNDHIRDEL